MLHQDQATKKEKRQLTLSIRLTMLKTNVDIGESEFKDFFKKDFY